MELYQDMYCALKKRLQHWKKEVTSHRLFKLSMNSDRMGSVAPKLVPTESLMSDLFGSKMG